MDEADFLSRIALELDAELTMASTAELVAEYARITTAADESGILFIKSRREVATMAATSDRVTELHDLQRDFDEGPCLDAIRSEHLYLIDDTAEDQRWPRWGASAVQVGIRSVLSLRLEAKSRSYGALNLYAEAPGAFGYAEIAIAKNFTRHASIALSTAYTAEGLTVAIDARTFIGQAQGILMARYGLTAERAFEYLRRRSQEENIKLSDIAHDVIDHRDDDSTSGDD